MTQSPRRVLIEADGGSRGNPGPAAYGALLKDADTGEVLAERGEQIGVATNNVAEYRGLIAGLELYREHADGADLEVRMDSKLVVEQMSGRWKIKHPSMRPLAMQAHGLAPFGTTYRWIPRERNTHADRLANEALDSPDGVSGDLAREEDASAEDPPPASSREPEQAPATTEDRPAEPVDSAAQTPVPRPPWEQGPPTVLVLVRHGDTALTQRRVFSGAGGEDPPLVDEGRAQVGALADWLVPGLGADPVVLASPMRRTRESAAILASRLGTRVEEDPDLVEAHFGAWEGLTYAEVVERDPDAFTTWLGDADHRAGGTGDSRTSLSRRMTGVRDRLLDAHAGRVVVVVSHLTPIKLLLNDVLGLSLAELFRTEVSPASVSVAAWYPDGRAVVRLLNGGPAPPQVAALHTVR